jgi:hypothetical protein
MAMHDVEFFVLVAVDGDFVVHKDRDEIEQDYVDNIGGQVAGARILKVSLQVETQDQDTELSASVLLPALKAMLAVK